MWSDVRNGNGDVYLYDLSTSQEKQITTNLLDQYYPLISGDKILWADRRNGNWDVYLYDLSIGQERQVTNLPADQYGVSSFGNNIVWRDDRNMSNIDIYMTTIS